MQTVGLVKESQVPAQATPALETVTILEAVDSKVNVSVIAFPRESWAAAPNDKVSPSSRDAFGDGFNVTTAGTWLLVTCVGLPLLQEARKKQPKIPRIDLI